ncbi:MAG: hypothetical protein WD468_00175 [Pirellulales bacterium]
MSLTIELSGELEAKLHEQASAEGKSPEELVLEALEERFADETAARAILPPDEWIAAFNAWIAQHKSRNPAVDDSRESIYSDRG